MKTATKMTYHVEFRDGFSALGHFGREIAADLGSRDFDTLAEARAALKSARDRHERVNGISGCRFDLVASDGRRWSWE